MSSINQSIYQSTTQSQQLARGRTGNALRQTHAPVQRKHNGFQHAQAVMHHHVEGLVVSYLDQYPGLFACLLQKHETWLAQYLRAHYNMDLPTRQGLKCPAPSHLAAKADIAGAGTQFKAPSPASLSKPAEQEREPESSTNLPTSRTTISRRPSIDSNGDSPQSISSQLSAWPTEEDLNVPYPAPKKYLDREAGLSKGKGYKWTFEEQDLAIEYMYDMRDDPTMPRTEKRFEEVSRRLMEQYGIERSKDSVKNMWNRIGRQRSKYDERKNKSAPLATSQQGKQARLEHEAKRNGKRKASAEPAEPVQKKTKTTSLGDDLVFDPHAWDSTSAQEKAKANASLDALFSDQGDGALPQYVRPSDLYNSSQIQTQVSSNQDLPPTTVSPAFPAVRPSNLYNSGHIQPQTSGTQDLPSTTASPAYPALPTLTSDAFGQITSQLSGTQGATPTTASPAFPDLPTLMAQLEEGPRPGVDYMSDEDFAKMMMEEHGIGNEVGMDEFGLTAAFYQGY